MGIVDPFRSIATSSEWGRIKALEKATARSAPRLFIIVSNLHLDSPALLRNFRSLLEGFLESGSIPAMFILMGNFCSKPFGANRLDRDSYKAQMDALAACFEAFPDVASQTHVVLVPGPHDPGSPKILPRSPIPSYFTQSLARVLPYFTSASNPCRLRFFTQEIVIFRGDMTGRLQRRSLIPSSPSYMPSYEHVSVDRSTSLSFIHLFISAAHCFS